MDRWLGGQGRVGKGLSNYPSAKEVGQEEFLVLKDFGLSQPTKKTNQLTTKKVFLSSFSLGRGFFVCKGLLGD
ncbi:hypothetical protein BTR22_04295 [Alkalihalophilus pseudofirmus]|nr:hypothetical protein BTR22_04295 [Alkalihalophilus pseudofirmus]